MNESTKNTRWYRALKILYIWSFALSIIVAITTTNNESSDVKSFAVSSISLILLIIFVFLAIKKSFLYILFSKKNTASENKQVKNLPPDPQIYSNEIGQSYMEENLLKAADYAGELLRGGKTPIKEVFSRASKKYNVPEKVISMLVRIEP